MATKNPTAAEVLGDKIPFTFDGVDYLIEPSSEWDYTLAEDLEAGRVVAFLKGILGEDQHEKFKATKPKLNRVNALIEAIQTASGIQGN